MEKQKQREIINWDKRDPDRHFDKDDLVLYEGRIYERLISTKELHENFLKVVDRTPEIEDKLKSYPQVAEVGDYIYNCSDPTKAFKVVVRHTADDVWKLATGP